MTVKQWLSSKAEIVRLYWNSGVEARRRWDEKKRIEEEAKENGHPR